MLPPPQQFVQSGMLDGDVENSLPLVLDFCLSAEFWPCKGWVFLPGNSRWGRMGGSEIRGQARSGRREGRSLGDCGKRKGD